MYLKKQSDNATLEFNKQEANKHREEQKRVEHLPGSRKVKLPLGTIYPHRNLAHGADRDLKKSVQ
jgi:hypothetical protein